MEAVRKRKISLFIFVDTTFVCGAKEYTYLYVYYNNNNCLMILRSVEFHVVYACLCMQKVSFFLRSCHVFISFHKNDFVQFMAKAFVIVSENGNAIYKRHAYIYIKHRPRCTYKCIGKFNGKQQSVVYKRKIMKFIITHVTENQMILWFRALPPLSLFLQKK